jgi:hypothetical protein
MEWAQLQETLQQSKDNLKAWHKECGHLVRGTPFGKPDYDLHIGNIHFHRHFYRDRWEGIETLTKQLEKKKTNFLLYWTDKVDELEDDELELTDYEMSDLEDAETSDANGEALR